MMKFLMDELSFLRHKIEHLQISNNVQTVENFLDAFRIDENGKRCHVYKEALSDGIVQPSELKCLVCNDPKDIHYVY